MLTKNILNFVRLKFYKSDSHPKTMTRYRQLHIYILLTLFSFFALNIYGQKANKNVKPKKGERSEFVADIQPDHIARKARPDRHPKELPMPNLFSKGGGRHVYGSTGLHGIDVSHYQGRIDWDQVARDPNAGYVYLKATEGANYTDDTYQRNFSECKRVGLKVGSYLFFRPNTSASVQFEQFRSVVNTRQQDLIPLIDAESMNGVSIATFQSRLLELCQLLEKEYGKAPLIYTGRNFYNKNIHGNAKLTSYKFFIAAYSMEEPQLYGDEDYLMWQYTAQGRVQGIRGDVDMSHFVGSHTLKEILY